jgi:hypothetical protein
MTLVEWLTVSGLVLGPAVAVAISLVVEDRRQRAQRKFGAIRTLLVGRLNMADPNFQTAINTVPVDFRGDEGVLTAWEAYIAAVQPGPAEGAQERWNAALSKLLQAMLISTGYSERDAGKIGRSAYVSTSSAQMYILQTDALRAVIDVARNTGRLADVNEKLVPTIAPKS